MEGDVVNINVLFSIFILYYYTKKKKKNAIKAKIHPSGFYTISSSIICSVDNGMSRCMFINANQFNHDCPVVFFKYVFKRLRPKKKKKSPRGGYIALSSLSAHATACGFERILDLSKIVQLIVSLVRKTFNWFAIDFYRRSAGDCSLVRFSTRTIRRCYFVRTSLSVCCRHARSAFSLTIAARFDCYHVVCGMTKNNKIEIWNVFCSYGISPNPRVHGAPYYVKCII
jgi:hypothetical protein